MVNKVENNQYSEQLNILAVSGSKNYTAEEVKHLFKHFVKSVDFIDFTREYGITGWKELNRWLEKNVK